MRKSLPLETSENHLRILDQTRLPHEEVWRAVESPEQMAKEIHSLAVRGAPLIGVAAALSFALYCREERDQGKRKKAWELLRAARPTAVNLMNALDRLMPLIHENFPEIYASAAGIFDEDVALCKRMAERGAAFIESGDGILTHCNTGGLATVGVGTALGVIRHAHEQGKKIHVYVDETRPLLQGARLTAWELEKLKIPYTLISDNMAASLMAKGKVQKIFVGADRIAENGDVANKIGTYGVAVLAKHHEIPFYVVAPETTRDRKCPDGASIPIEERDPEEVRAGKSPKQAPVWNPSFDVTPRSLITKIVLDSGLL